MSSRAQASDNAGLKRCVRPVAVSTVIGAAVCALILLLMAVVLSSRTIPQFAVDPMAALALCAGGFAAGFCCARIMREKGLLYGALCGAVMAVIVILCGLTLRDNSFGIPALFKVTFIMFPAMLGGVLGVNARRRRK